MLACTNGYVKGQHVSHSVKRNSWDYSIKMLGHGGEVTVARYNPRFFHVIDTTLPEPPTDAPSLGSNLAAVPRDMSEVPIARVLVLGSNDRTFTLWRDPIQRPVFHVKSGCFKLWISDVAWSPDGYTLFVASFDGTVVCVKLDASEIGVRASDETVRKLLAELGGGTGSGSDARHSHKRKALPEAPDMFKAHDLSNHSSSRLSLDSESAEHLPPSAVLQSPSPASVAKVVPTGTVPAAAVNAESAAAPHARTVGSSATTSVSHRPVLQSTSSVAVGAALPGGCSTWAVAGSSSSAALLVNVGSAVVAAVAAGSGRSALPVSLLQQRMGTGQSGLLDGRGLGGGGMLATGLLTRPAVTGLAGGWQGISTQGPMAAAASAKPAVNGNGVGTGNLPAGITHKHVSSKLGNNSASAGAKQAGTTSSPAGLPPSSSQAPTPQQQQQQAGNSPAPPSVPVLPVPGFKPLLSIPGERTDLHVLVSNSVASGRGVSR